MHSGLLGKFAEGMADAGRRVISLAFGKAMAFTYAVIVSVVANVVFEFVREPPHPGSSSPTIDAALETAASPVARAALPAVSPIRKMDIKRAETIPATAPPATPPPETPHPGPGSGGLY